MTRKNAMQSDPRHYNAFHQKGFKLMNADDYNIMSGSDDSYLLQEYYNHLQLDPSPGSRYRSYLKLIWNRDLDMLTVANDQSYYQSAQANNVDGGKQRVFSDVPDNIVKNTTLQKIIHYNIQFIQHSTDIQALEKVYIGMHFIRYQATENSVSYSSPVWLHVDDEPIVFVHLISLSQFALGGNNILASHEDVPLGIIRLNDFMDTLVLNRAIKHAVTPLGVKQGLAYRDILLFTIEPESTNQRKY